VAFFQTKLADNVFVNLEAEAAGGLAKGVREAGNAEVSPEMAFINVAKTAGLMAAAFSARVGPILKQAQGAKMDVSFGIKVAQDGAVMVSSQTGIGQFHVTLHYGG
jgi:hypothetical protein